jgi:hypothetical protein
LPIDVLQGALLFSLGMQRFRMLLQNAFYFLDRFGISLDRVAGNE